MIIKSRVGHNGQEIYGFEITGDIKETEEITISGNILDTKMDKGLAELDGRTQNGVKSVTVDGETVKIDVVPFPISCKFTLKVGKKEYTAEDGEVKTDWADKFVAHEEGDVKYRLYSPKHTEPRPLILFLHGGGECGFDNKAQIYNCFGAAKLAESYPDVYILAPQAPGNIFNPENMAKMLKKRTYATDNVQNGWSREYLAQIGDIIRRMIKEGTVNPERVYVTGMSMGGAGTLYALSTIGDLFAAAVCICPTINPEIYGILTGLTHTKIWVACAYLDHLYYRHKYCTDGVMALRDGGNKDAHLTIFSPEDMEKYGISVLDDMTLAEKAAWNHACWVPTYYNEYGIMSWMMDQRKN